MRFSKRRLVGERGDVTLLLHELGNGSESALDELLPLVYEELKRLAGSYLRRERSDHTLQSTALAHEAYLRLIDQRNSNWKSRAHFFGVAAQAIRRILIDHAKHHGRRKRGGGLKRLSLDDVATISAGEVDTDLLALDLTLAKLAAEDSESARLVELRFFGGLTNEEIGEVMGVSERTVRRHWQFARAWLYRELTEAPSDREGYANAE